MKTKDLTGFRDKLLEGMHLAPNLGWEDKAFLLLWMQNPAES
jgi:hypothetical protein